MTGAEEIFRELVEKGRVSMLLRGHAPCPFCGERPMISRRVGLTMIGAPERQGYAFRVECSRTSCCAWTRRAVVGGMGAGVKQAIEMALAGWDERGDKDRA